MRIHCTILAHILSEDVLSFPTIYRSWFDHIALVFDPVLGVDEDIPRTVFDSVVLLSNGELYKNGFSFCYTLPDATGFDWRFCFSSDEKLLGTQQRFRACVESALEDQYDVLSVPFCVNYSGVVAAVPHLGWHRNYNLRNQNLYLRGKVHEEPASTNGDTLGSLKLKKADFALVHTPNNMSDKAGLYAHFGEQTGSLDEHNRQSTRFRVQHGITS